MATASPALTVKEMSCRIVSVPSPLGTSLPRFSTSMIAAMLRTTLFLILSLAATPALAKPAILVFGDSLSAGYGIALGESWPALLERRLAERRLDYTVVNASISGETPAGGRSRLPAELSRTKPAVVIIELGANDGLRGLPLSAMRENLATMVRAAKAAGARVLLVGMRLPPNYGPDYANRFAAVFAEVAREEKTAFLPFLLEPLGAGREHYQADGLHPTAAAQPLLLDHVWPALKPLLKACEKIRRERGQDATRASERQDISCR